MLDPLLQATRYAIHDRCRSWHSRHAPDECLEENQVFDHIADPDTWMEVISGKAALRCQLRAPNGKDYPITYLPVASYALRYWVVMQLADFANGLWTARVGAERLCSRSFRSLFLGRIKKNEMVYHAWMNAQISRYLLRVDVTSFYDAIPHESLCKVIRSSLGEKLTDNAHMALDLLPSLLRYRYQFTGTSEVHVCDRGLPIGNTTERFFSNLYLAKIDEFLLSQPKIFSCRKLDDIRIYGDEKLQLQEIRDQVETRLLSLGLVLNQSKTRITDRTTANR